MSSQMALAPEHVCYVHCNFCNTILAVSVPSNNMLTIVTVRCGYCANLLSVNMGALLQFQPVPIQQFQHNGTKHVDYGSTYASSSRCNRTPLLNPFESDHQRFLSIRPPGKKQRVPSAYNRFIKEEIQRIKACNPDISHREAFSAAAKNWAHFPHIHFGLNLEADKQLKTSDPLAGAEGPPDENQGFC